MVRVKNVLTAQEDRIEVPSEEAIVEIQERWVGGWCGLFMCGGHTLACCWLGADGISAGVGVEVPYEKSSKRK